jgi:glucoamylase
VLAAALVVLAGLGAVVWDGRHATIPLHQQTAVRDVDGVLVPLGTPRYAVEAGRLVGPGRVLPAGGAGGPGAADVRAGTALGLAAADAVWLLRGAVPGQGTAYAPMARQALLDLRVLTAPAGAVPGALLAAPSPNWRYVWPRDAAFAAVAYARTGRLGDAVAVLGFVQAQQARDGSMQARYLPSGESAVPDDRGLQEDGPGWALWAVSEVLRAETDPTRREAAAQALAPLAARSTARLLARRAPVSGLPQASPDYWEVAEDRLTLGIAATAMVGLERAAWLQESGLVAADAWAAVGVDPGLLAAEAAQLRRVLVGRFGPDFPRHVGGRPDAAVTFLLPPFTDCAVPGAEAARRAAVPAMRRPAGGVAPGAGWRQDGVSWTPQTALQALAAAASGRAEEADGWLAWLDRHRTAAGSLPEKVLHDGSPAAVAPLAWTSAVVLLTLVEPSPASGVGC